jgi:hypothetical protein
MKSDRFLGKLFMFMSGWMLYPVSASLGIQIFCIISGILFMWFGSRILNNLIDPHDENE